jgi:hypothetical protein
MSKDVTKISSLTTEISAYTATFTALGLVLIGESRSDLTYAVHATKGGVLFGTPQIDRDLKAAVNALIAELGLKPTSNHPVFP